MKEASPSTAGSEAPEKRFLESLRLNSDLFLVSALSLFLELTLIRWVGTEIRIFAYLQNTVLVVCFLGLGMGFLTADQPIRIRDSLKALAILLLLMSVPVSRAALLEISSMLSTFGDFVIWDHARVKNQAEKLAYLGIGLALTFMLMSTIVEIFVPIGRLCGRLMQIHPNVILAYSVNIGGSLIGVWLFALPSLFSLPPSTWFAVVALMWLYVVARFRTGLPINLALAGAVFVLGFFCSLDPKASEIVWSPYQKLVLRPSNQDGDLGVYTIDVNNNHYQEMLDLGSATVDADPQKYPPELKGLSQYDLPYLLHPNPEKVLIVGAGSGNDAAGALRAGVNDVTALDIDPVILRMGKELHPERPYDSPGVKLVVDDARSYFASSDEKFDLIVFGLLDSHSSTSMSNTRLDHYVYTVQSLTQARNMLKPGGMVVLSFFVVHDFIGRRISRTLEQVFGRPPLLVDMQFTNFGRGGYIFVAGDLETANSKLRSNARFMEQAVKYKWLRTDMEKEAAIAPADDDWPYIYLREPGVPLLYFLLGALLLALLYYCRMRFGSIAPGSGWRAQHWHFFLLGAAFLLLEVQNISRASVVLGSTWWVNAIIISAVLMMILLSNMIAYRFPKLNLNLVYAGLLISCLSLYWIDLASFAWLPYVPRAFLVGVLSTLPMLFSGVVFISSLASVEDKGAALGTNLFGALVGGLAQSITFYTGISFLLLLVTMLYLAAAFTRPAGVRASA